MSRGKRSEVIDPDEVGVYHAWGRCAQQAVLCGVDPNTGKDYEHRRDWIVGMEENLVALFAIEVCFHAELSNHFHLVLRNRPDLVLRMSDAEVVRRVLAINKLTRNLLGEVEEVDEKRVARECEDAVQVVKYRRRLADPSWFMKALRENISRRANEEAGTKGTFWDGRFGCRRLLDEPSILICGIYVDLNQIRAGEAETPEESVHTSAYERIEGRRARQLVAAGELSMEEVERTLPDGWLAELTLDERHAGEEIRAYRSKTGRRPSDRGVLNVELDHYLELLDWSGRLTRDGAAAIPAHLEPILERLSIQREVWGALVQHFDTIFGSIAGHAQTLARTAESAGRRMVQRLQAVMGACGGNGEKEIFLS